MTGGFNLPKPEFDIEATVDRAMALINRTLEPPSRRPRRSSTRSVPASRWSRRAIWSTP